MGTLGGRTSPVGGFGCCRERIVMYFRIGERGFVRSYVRWLVVSVLGDDGEIVWDVWPSFTARDGMGCVWG